MANEVLTLPELLEAILLELPTRELLLSQKVSRTWKQLIDGSPAIQKALFFTSGDASDITVKGSGQWAFYRQAMLNHDLAPNPLLFWCDRFSDLSFDGAYVLRRNALTAGPHASCHRMLITQPSTPLLTILEVSMQNCFTRDVHHKCNIPCCRTFRFLVEQCTEKLRALKAEAYDIKHPIDVYLKLGDYEP